MDELSSAHAEQLTRWAAHSSAITRFEELLTDWEDAEILNWLAPKKPLDCLCEAYEIDRKILDDARRVLLAQQRQANKTRETQTTPSG